MIGAGRIGGGIARQLARAGHELLLSYSRDPKRLIALARDIGGAATAGDVREAAEIGDVVVLSVPWTKIPEVLTVAGPLTGKVVIDTTNHFGPTGLETLPAGRTAARFNADRMPGARLVKAFNTLTSGFQRSAAGRETEPVVLFLCGDDPEAKALVAGLIEDAGFAPCDLGGLDAAGPMEAPRRPGAVYGEEYRPSDARAVQEALAAGGPIPPTPKYA
ncbi:NADPH-dependent F420 reductase [Flindersiella endophytica]